MKQPVQFLAIGDILTDAFIELDPNYARTQTNRSNTELVMPFGMKVPYRGVNVLPGVGNGPNASVSASRLGISSGALCHVGNDDFGRECIDNLANNRVSTDYVVTEEGQSTNYHYVLSLSAERTILIKHASFTYNLAEQFGSDTALPSWVYFTSVAENSLPYHAEIAKWISDNNIKMTFQPGSFQISLGYEKLADIYRAAEVFVCNVEEAELILKMSDTPHTRGTPEFISHVRAMMASVRELGPRIAVITDGPNGAFASDGAHDYFMPIYPDPKPPVERTGAGDSFASTLSVFLSMGMSLADSLVRAPINSMNVVQYVGAQAGLLSRDQLEQLLADAPEDYRLMELV